MSALPESDCQPRVNRAVVEAALAIGTGPFPGGAILFDEAGWPLLGLRLTRVMLDFRLGRLD